MSPPPRISRRTITIGGALAIGAAMVAGGIFELPKLIKHRARGHYADLVNRLDDPEQAAIVGRVVDKSASDTAQSFEEEAASDLKRRLAKQNLSQLMRDDSADIGSLVEADGWVIPRALAELCVLAALSV